MQATAIIEVLSRALSVESTQFEAVESRDGMPTLYAPLDLLVDACRVLRDAPELRFVFLADVTAGGAERLDLGVGRRIRRGDGPVVPPPDHHAAENHHRAHRHFPGRAPLRGFGQRGPHVLVMRHGARLYPGPRKSPDPKSQIPNHKSQITRSRDHEITRSRVHIPLNHSASSASSDLP